MSWIIEFFQRLNHLEDLIRWGGYAVLAAIVFAETGLLIGFFLPGDSLLATAGLLASRGYLNIWELFFLLALMAIAGDSVGYAFGKTTGPRIFKREKSLLFAKDHLLKAQAFYEKHGGKTILLARFIPIVRTFAPIVAGVGRMGYKKFVVYNVIGGVLWTGSMLGLGYVLGRTIPDVDRYIFYVILAIILLSIGPGIFVWIKDEISKKEKGNKRNG